MFSTMYGIGLYYNKLYRINRDTKMFKKIGSEPRPQFAPYYEIVLLFEKMKTEQYSGDFCRRIINIPHDEVLLQECIGNIQKYIRILNDNQVSPYATDNNNDRERYIDTDLTVVLPLIYEYTGINKIYWNITIDCIQEHLVYETNTYIVTGND